MMPAPFEEEEEEVTEQEIPIAQDDQDFAEQLLVRKRLHAARMIVLQREAEEIRRLEEKAAKRAKKE